MPYYKARFTHNQCNPFVDIGVESVLFTAKDDKSALRKSYEGGTIIRKWWSRYAKADGKWAKRMEQAGFGPVEPLLHRLVRLKKRGRGFVDDLEVYGPWNRGLLRELH